MFTVALLRIWVGRNATVPCRSQWMIPNIFLTLCKCMYVIKQWKLVWAVPWPSLLLQEIKDNLEAVGRSLLPQGFLKVKWLSSSRLVFILFELVLRVSALTVPFSLPLCVVCCLLFICRSIYVSIYLYLSLSIYIYLCPVCLLES